MSSKQPDTSKAARIQADATKQAAELQLQAQREALALQDRLFGEQQNYLREQDEYNRGITQQNQQNYQPYIDAGQTGLGLLTGTVTDPNSWLNQQFTGENLENDPGYQFRRDQGQNALNQSLAAKGGLLSGAALKATEKFSQGLAGDEFSNAYQRFTNDRNNRYNQLANLSNLGLSGAQGFASGSPGSDFGNQMSNISSLYGSNVSNMLQNTAANQSDLLLSNAQQQAQYALMGQNNNSFLGGYGGVLGGAALGAMKGSAVPGVGTVMGGLIGGLSSLL